MPHVQLRPQQHVSRVGEGLAHEQVLAHCLHRHSSVLVIGISHSYGPVRVGLHLGRRRTRPHSYSRVGFFLRGLGRAEAGDRIVWSAQHGAAIPRGLGRRTQPGGFTASA